MCIRDSENYERRFAESIASAKQLAEEFELKLPEVIGLGEKNMDVTLKEAAKMASEGAGKHLETLKSEISATIDTSTAEGRNAVKTAVSSARGLVTQGPKAVPLFQTWKALTDAASDAGFASLPVALETAKANITTGLEWHNRQTADGKLRLKALAAQSFTPVKGADADCPLCTAPLDDEAKRALSVELEEMCIRDSHSIVYRPREGRYMRHLRARVNRRRHLSVRRHSLSAKDICRSRPH